MAEEFSSSSYTSIDQSIKCNEQIERMNESINEQKRGSFAATSAKFKSGPFVLFVLDVWADISRHRDLKESLAGRA
jgi:hypothetical protein